MFRFSLCFALLGGVFAAAHAADPSSASPQPVPPFQRIEVSGNADIRLVQGETESIALPARLPRGVRIRADLRGDTLRVRVRDETHWWDRLWSGKSGRATPIIVTFRTLDAIAASGAVHLSAARIQAPALRIDGAGAIEITIDDLVTGELRLRGAGAIEATLAGRADVQHVTISGAGEYHGSRLTSQDATVDVSGAGSVVVNAQKSLTATLSGAGRVEYLGNPDMRQTVRGAGSVRRREPSDS
jgi:hypothetical protein